MEPASPAGLDEGDLASIFVVITATAVARDLAAIAAIAGRELTHDDVEHLTWAFAEMATGFSAAAHAEAVDAAHAWSRRIAEWWASPDDPGYDLLLTPTLAAPTPLHRRGRRRQPRPERPRSSARSRTPRSRSPGT